MRRIYYRLFLFIELLHFVIEVDYFYFKVCYALLYPVKLSLLPDDSGIFYVFVKLFSFLDKPVSRRDMPCRMLRNYKRKESAITM